MVNKAPHGTHPTSTEFLPAAAILVKVYLAVVLGTLATLVMLEVTAPRLATTDAWGHAVIVAVLAIVLPIRLRHARSGHRGAVRAVGLIAAALVVVNIVEALTPGFVPGWMRLDMAFVAVLMIGVTLDVIRWAVVHKN